MSGFLAQNGTVYEIWIARDDGTRLAALDDVLTLDYVRAINNLERFQLTLPGDTNPNWIAKDRRISIWRQPVGGRLVQDFQGLLTQWTWAEDARGNLTLKISGPSLNGLLRRRIVAYAAGSAQAAQTNQADDMMKAIVKQNLGADATDTARSIDPIYLSVAADLTAGPSLTKGMAYRNVLEILAELSDAARQAGTEIYFDVEPIDDVAFEFRTYANQPGNDRRASSSQPLIFSKERGNLSAPVLTYNYDDEINFAYAGGQGTESSRVIKTAEDSARSGLSVFARAEGFADARSDSADDGVQAAADAELIAGRPAVTFSANLIDTESCRYGVEWRWGDRVTAEAFGAQYDGLIRSVHVTVTANRQETIAAQLEASVMA